MKLLIASALASIVSGVSAAASNPEALIYVFEPESTGNAKPTSISPGDARLFFAQHLGLSQYYDLAGASSEVIELLNTYGVPKQDFFSRRRDSDEIKRSLVMISDLEKPSGMFPSIQPIATIIFPPSLSAADLLNKDFRSQNYHQYAGDLLKGSDMKECYAKLSRDGESGTYTSIPLPPQDIQGTVDKIEWFLQSVTPVPGKGDPLNYASISASRDMFDSDETHQEAVSRLAQTLLNVAEGPKHELVVVVTSVNYRTPAELTAASYGPSDLLENSKSKWAHIRREVFGDQEEPLSFTKPKVSNKPVSSSSQTNVSRNAVIKTTMPKCYSSQSKCTNATNACTGHGSCQLLYTDKKENTGSPDVGCWVCACVPTVRTNSDGKKKTTIWAGPACQKKDISSPFWLIAGLTIALIGITSWGIGLMFSIGEEDLPSVIGAGVAGPRAQK
ncbi:hypothetical protein MMC25_000214 [Agyrium rufum]|nr:hypothetical protein [Agyrium rufum]